MPAPETPWVASDILIWRVRQQMSLREIYTARALKKRLAEVGYDISEAQISRMKNSLPKQLDLRLMAALCLVLDVTPGDLLTRKGATPPAVPEKPATAAKQDASSRTNADPAIPASSQSILKNQVYPLNGPVIKPMSRGKL